MSLTEIAVAIVFLWAGAVIAISFMEAPLKFRAPGITIPLGLGIGRLVFGALNLLEVIFAAVLITALVATDPPTSAARLGVLVGAVLVAQFLLRIPLDRRTRAVIAGEVRAGSAMHLVYIGLEVVKLVALLVLGAALLGALVQA